MSLFTPTRDEVRDFFFNTWAKFRAQQPLSAMEKIGITIIQMHPEYHNVLNAPEKYRQQTYFPELGETNPFLHMSLHVSILEQISINQPIGITKIYASLKKQYQEEHLAQHDVLECLAETVWLAQRNNSGPDNEHYLTLLNKKIGKKQ